jgi:hypothetical protein
MEGGGGDAEEQQGGDAGEGSGQGGRPAGRDVGEGSGGQAGEDCGGGASKGEGILVSRVCGNQQEVSCCERGGMCNIPTLVEDFHWL